MKTILLFVIASALIGFRSRRLRWPQLALLALMVGGYVAWSTFNVVFRYIPVK